MLRGFQNVPRLFYKNNNGVVQLRQRFDFFRNLNCKKNSNNNGIVLKREIHSIITPSLRIFKKSSKNMNARFSSIVVDDGAKLQNDSKSSNRVTTVYRFVGSSNDLVSTQHNLQKGDGVTFLSKNGKFQQFCLVSELASRTVHLRVLRSDGQPKPHNLPIQLHRTDLRTVLIHDSSASGVPFDEQLAEQLDNTVRQHLDTIAEPVLHTLQALHDRQLYDFNSLCKVVAECLVNHDIQLDNESIAALALGWLSRSTGTRAILPFHPQILFL